MTTPYPWLPLFGWCVHGVPYGREWTCRFCAVIGAKVAAWTAEQAARAPDGITQGELAAALPHLWDHPDDMVADAYENGGWEMVAAAIFEYVRRDRA